MTTTAKKMGITFPVAAGGTGASLLSRCDPVCGQLLVFYKAVLNAGLGEAFASAMAGQNMPDPDGNRLCVASTTNVDPAVFPFPKLKAPHLAMFPVSDEDALERSLQHTRSVTKYTLQWTLPPMRAEKAEAVFPALVAARMLIIAATEKVVNLEYEDGDSPFEGTGIEKVLIGGARYGALVDSDGPVQLVMPSMVLDVNVHRIDEWAETGDTLDYIKIAVGLSGTGDEPEDEDVVAHTNVTVPDT